MKSRRELLLGMVAGAAGAGLLSSRAYAWDVEEMTPERAYEFERDSTTLTLNAPGISSYSHALADAVGGLDALEVVKGLWRGQTKYIGEPGGARLGVL